MRRPVHSNVHSIVIKWFASYMVVFLIPLVMFISLSVRYMQKLTTAIQYYDGLAAGQVRLAFDAIVEQANSVANEIAGLPEIDVVLSGKKETLKAWDYYQASQQLAKLRKRQGISEILVSVPAYDLVLTLSSYASFRLYYDSYLAGSSLSYEEFAGLASEKYSGPVFKDFTYDQTGGGEKTLMIRPLRLFPRGKQYANLVLILDRLDEEAVARQHIAILDTVRHDFIYGNHIPPFTAEHLEQVYSVQKEAVFTSPVEGHDYLFASSVSGLQNWVYFVYGDTRVLLSEAELLKDISVLVLALCVLLGFLVVVSLIRRSYLQVDDVMKRFDDQPFSGRGNEFTYIGDSITRLQSEKKEQSRLLHDRLLTSLVDIPESTRLPDRHDLEEAGILFPSPIFFVMILARNDAMAVDAVTRCFKEAGCGIYPFAYPSGDGFILNGLDEARVRGLARRMAQAVDCGISLSDQSMTYRSLSQAYQQARDVEEYRLMHPEIASVMMYGDMLSLAQGKEFSYPVEAELAISDAIRHGDEEMVMREMDALIQKNKEAGISPLSLRFLLFNINGTIIKAFSRMDERLIITSSPLQMIPPILQSTDIGKTVQEVKAMVHAITAMERRHAVTVQQQQEAAWDIAIVGYISEHYQEKSLSVTSVAEELGLSPVNLSRLFKKTRGCLVSDYINEVRIGHAKEIMASESNFAAVADACGFGSLRTFMRVFKQMEKMTPGQYRALSVDSEGDI